ncbi:MAG TPA: hypothetical protein VGA66_04475, partial [Mycobacterium sp.]
MFSRASMGEETAVLQLVRLKGRPTWDDITQATSGLYDARPALRALVEAGSCVEQGDRLKVTPEGRAHLASLLEEERRDVDAAAFQSAYGQFDAYNAEFKQIVTDWQVRDGEPNSHGDVGYDRHIVERLVSLHGRFRDLLEDICRLTARLLPYPTRFDTALEKVKLGD